MVIQCWTVAAWVNMGAATTTTFKSVMTSKGSLLSTGSYNKINVFAHPGTNNYGLFNQDSSNQNTNTFFLKTGTKDSWSLIHVFVSCREQLIQNMVYLQTQSLQ